MKPRDQNLAPHQITLEWGTLELRGAADSLAQHY